MSRLSDNCAARVWRNAPVLILFLLLPSGHSFAQGKKQPNKYALTPQEQVFAQAACISQKFGPGGAAAWYSCQDSIMDGMVRSKKLRYFEGDWRLRGQTKASPWSSAGEFTRNERNEWEEQDWSLVSHWKEQRPAGPSSGTLTYGYDLKRKLYTSRQAGPAEAAQEATGVLEKGVWTWTGTTRLKNGKTAKDRWIVRTVSATAYRFQLQIASPKGAWMTVLEGTAAKLP